ncbi:Cathepsin O [Microtus ochrogaster]|uniref:Cathepsin O n=1 Tax=Microtus ochrogaster TaxID=79684 RepID=A0A8J6KSJ8_MICOH|nr:Cathepsin O [Microtus ochrogaster]
MKPRWASLLLLCCCCCLGRGVARTWPRSHQREAAALRVPSSFLYLSPAPGLLGRDPRSRRTFPQQRSLLPKALIPQDRDLCDAPQSTKISLYLGSKAAWSPKYPAEGQTPVPNVSLPLKFDWRDKHVVNQVRNQKMCGGCWAFSVVGAIESAHGIQGKPQDDLSVQQVIDCSFNNYGCSGGSPLSALSWLNEVKLVEDSEYPFKAQNGLCRYFPQSQAGVSIKGFSAYDFSDQEDEMAKALLSFGPLVVIVDAVSWQDYLGGIIQHHCSSGEANHAVLITGFDKTGNTPYWMVRNSWGSSWGIEGYAHVKMGGNVCGKSWLCVETSRLNIKGF